MQIGLLRFKILVLLLRNVELCVIGYSCVFHNFHAVCGCWRLPEFSACIADEKPFHCDVPRCSQSFKTSYNLRDHKRLKHYHMLRYQCSKCHKYVCSSVGLSVCHTGLLIFTHVLFGGRNVLKPNFNEIAQSVTWLHGSRLVVVIWRPVGCGLYGWG